MNDSGVYDDEWKNQIVNAGAIWIGNNLTFSTVVETYKINYKYAEDRILEDLKAYVDSTYEQHYKTNKDKGLEAFDVWIALGDATSSFRDTAIKYLWRAGKKGTSEDEKKDLMKAMHYIMLCLYSNHYR